MAPIVRDTPNQRLVQDCEKIWRQYGLPSGDLRLAMQAVGDVDKYATDPFGYEEYKHKITAKAVAARAAEAALYLYEDPDRRGAAAGRWNAMADAVEFPKHRTVRGGFWVKALGCAELVQQFKGTDESADARIQAALDDWKAGQRPDGSALDDWFPRGDDAELPDETAESTGDPHLDAILGDLPGAVEAVDDTAPPEGEADPDAHAAELEQAEARRLNAADETLVPCEVCGGTVVEGACDTCGAHYLDGKLVSDKPSAIPPALPQPLTPETIKTASDQIWNLLKAAYPNEGKQQWINRYKDLAAGFTSASDRIRALDSIERALDEVKAYITDHPPVSEAEDDEPTGAPVASTGWNGETSGDLIIQAQNLARVLRGPETSVSIQPERLADIAWRSGLYPNVTSFERAFMVIWEGIELGIAPTAALKHIQVTMSKDKRIGTTQSIHLILALVFASGDCEAFTVKDGIVTVKRTGRPAATAKYSQTGDGAEKDIRRAVRYIIRQQFDDVLTFGLRVQKADANKLAVSDQGVAAL